MKYLMFIITYLGAMIFAWFVLWFVNIIEYLSSITLEPMIYSLISNHANWFLLTIISFITMFIYGLVPFAPMTYVNKAYGIWGRKKIIILIGLSLIILLDPAIKFYLPYSWFDFIDILQSAYYIEGPSELATKFTDSSTEHSRFDYIAVDVYIIAITILMYFYEEE